jgi:hypothetical protein
VCGRGRARISVAAGERRAVGEFMFVIASGHCTDRPDIQWDTSLKLGNV